MKRLISFFLIGFVVFVGMLRADEGMWIPMLMAKNNYADMKAKGLKLSAEDIYSINNASLKDAIVIFGGGCTGELISDKGLLITNHHCGFGAIQKHSSTEHDYLTDGFWAKNMQEELPNAGLKVVFLVRMDDVTNRVLQNITDKLSENERQENIKAAIAQIVNEAQEGNHYNAIVKPFYNGNQYYLFVQETFTDVRLVGAPNSAIGKFGGDTDNWMWPRHTGDFSLFRIYTGPDGKPADYSPENIPLKPKKFFPISLKGVKKGDFTMVFGYPGTTQQYLSSYAVEMYNKVDYPHRIKLRQAKLDIINAAMNSDPAIRIQYAAKQANIANAWKKWIGVIRGLNRLDAISKKQAFENEFTAWVNKKSQTQKEYGHILPRYKEIYTEFSKYNLASAYFSEAGFSLDAVRLVQSVGTILAADITTDAGQKRVKQSIKGFENFFKDFHFETDKAIFAKVTQEWVNSMDAEFVPQILLDAKIKYNGNIEPFVNELYANSKIVNKAELMKLLENYNAENALILANDPFVALYNDYISLHNNKIIVKLTSYQEELQTLDRLYMRAQMEMQPKKLFYPDANFTLRITYGKVDDYKPRDAVSYQHFSTLSGIIEKDNPEIYDYRVPTRLKELYDTKDFGNYAENGDVPVCFIASNHTSGGNSGSPVLNAEGQLIGVNFDRNWEGTMSDMMYDPSQCRNISLDIRYALFIVDKFAGAKWLIDEMQLIK